MNPDNNQSPDPLSTIHVSPEAKRLVLEDGNRLDKEHLQIFEVVPIRIDDGPLLIVAKANYDVDQDFETIDTLQLLSGMQVEVVTTTDLAIAEALWNEFDIKLTRWGAPSIRNPKSEKMPA